MITTAHNTPFGTIGHTTVLRETTDETIARMRAQQAHTEMIKTFSAHSARDFIAQMWADAILQES